MTTQLPSALKVLSAVKTLCRQKGHAMPKIVWGGVHATLDANSILHTFPEHYAISGEGEVPLLHLLDYFSGTLSYEDIKSRPGINFNTPGEKVRNSPYFNPDLDALADIDYFELDDLESYLTDYSQYFKRKLRTLPLLFARGCHWKCAFCYNCVLRKQGARYRTKSIEKITREMEPVLATFPMECASVCAEDFFLDEKLAMSWAALAKKHQLAWGANARFNYFGKVLTEENIRHYQESGLYMFGMSIESGDETTRNAILDKCVKDADIFSAMDMIQRVTNGKVAVATSFVVDFPGDTLHAKLETIKMMERVSKYGNVLFSGPQIYRPYPGSPLWKAHAHTQQTSIDDYIQEFDRTGTPKQDAIRKDNLFYSYFLMWHYNRFFHHRINLRLEDGHLTWDLAPACYDSESTFRKSLFASIQWRLKKNYWKYFYDPLILGTIVEVYNRYHAFKAKWFPRDTAQR